MIGGPKEEEQGSTCIYTRTNKEIVKGTSNKRENDSHYPGSHVLEANSKNLSACASETAQWVGTLVTKSSPVLPGTHVIEGENQLLQAIF